MGTASTSWSACPSACRSRRCSRSATGASTSTACAPPAPVGGRSAARASRGELTQQIAVDEVLYFHADDKYTCVRTAAGEALIRTPIAELASRLDP
ncbi:MAG: LytTR family transcriptional regulator, partial [Burkholderiales bacterium]|nr:LytTR family transcriptional regulator [Burkholderiales bacterium]